MWGKVLRSLLKTLGDRKLNRLQSPIKTRILIADDERDILDLLVFKLTQSGCEVVGESDGLTALESIESDPPRLAILDFMMSGLSGMDVILLTGRTGDSDIDAAFASDIGEEQVWGATTRLGLTTRRST